MATKEEYAAQLQQLAAGEIEELVVQPADFMAFQQAYRDSDLRTKVIGRALRGGVVHYRRRADAD